MKKDTSEMLKELQSCFDFNEFYSQNSKSLITETLSAYLNRLLEKHKLTKSEVIKRSLLNEIYAYQIFSGIRVPERKKLLSLSLGMGLDLEETQNLLKCSGYAQLYAKLEFDCIVIYGICKKLSVIEVNTLLFEHDLDTLG
ncbi:MAG: XRE family transcriptional regulator [Clostridia bacterium]|nr:XRE family transcriptional regulator [Clostridia bacterium]